MGSRHFANYVEALEARYMRNQARRQAQIDEIAKAAAIVPLVAGIGAVPHDVLAEVIAEEMARYDRWDAQDRARDQATADQRRVMESSNA